MTIQYVTPKRMNGLVVEDDPLMLQTIRFLLERRQIAPILSTDLSEALLAIEKSDPDFAVVDIQLGTDKTSGLQVLTAFKKRYPDRPVLMASGIKEIPTVIECIKRGASDYIEKPFGSDVFNLKLDKILNDEERTRVYRRTFQKNRERDEIIGKHPLLLQAKQAVKNAGGLRILLSGETGVGKTPFARYSNEVVAEIEKRPRPFEQINCSCLSVEYFQDQMFGHCKGAFTGAISDKKGLVQLAENGDLFLDEIGEMPLVVQTHLLTFLDTMEYYRLGEDIKRIAKVRILCATNRNLKERVAEGLFRKDLYSRLSQVEVVIPPLRERASDIPILFEHFIECFAGYRKPYSPEVLQLLERHQWEEGNVREFRNAVEYLCQLGRESERLELTHVDSRYRTAIASDDSGDVYSVGLERYLEQFEADILKSCVARYPRSLEAMANELKTSKATLYRRLRKYDLLRER